MMCMPRRASRHTKQCFGGFAQPSAHPRALAVSSRQRSHPLAVGMLQAHLTGGSRVALPRTMKIYMYWADPLTVHTAMYCAHGTQ